ncbi:MAG: lipoprotein insertase outer membrane protein LolB [Burkholderiales bacterium]
MRSSLVGLVAVLVLAGCASSAKRDLAPADPVAIDSFELNGRVSIKVKAENKGYPGKIRWQHQGAKEDLWIYTPLGNLVARLEQDENTAAITTAKGEEYRAGTLAFLARDVLGYDLPVDALQYWVRGLEWPKGRTNSLVKDDKGRLTALVQDQWEVSYQAWAAGNGLPSKMIVENDEMKLSLVIDRWQLGDFEEGDDK